MQSSTTFHDVRERAGRLQRYFGKDASSTMKTTAESAPYLTKPEVEQYRFVRHPQQDPAQFQKLVDALALR